MPDSRHYDWIDSLRGYAILLVIAVHATQVCKLPEVVQTFLNQGARGVQLFFVVSAVTLMMSWRARQDGVLAFYKRRFFRIAPMWWLAIIFWVLLQGSGRATGRRTVLPGPRSHRPFYS